VLDYLLRSHALGEVFPAPLSTPPEDLKVAAMWCFSMFGRRAPLTAFAAPFRTPPLNPLRTDSLFHIAVARGDTDAALAQLKAGVPLSLLARDGLPALHWALASRNAGMVGWLLDHGCNVDVRSSEGATALMSAAQSPAPGRFEELLARKADVNARDNRGFTALHRAAECGHEDVVRILLARGADRSVEAQGYTSLALAELKGHQPVVQLLR
jgi:ankyrin repeat protein